MTTPIDETLTHLAVEAWLKMETSEQSLHELGLIVEAKSQLYKAIMDKLDGLLEIDPNTNKVYDEADCEWNEAINYAKSNIKTLFGIEE